MEHRAIALQITRIHPRSTRIMGIEEAISFCDANPGHEINRVYWADFTWSYVKCWWWSVHSQEVGLHSIGAGAAGNLELWRHPRAL